MPAAWALVPIKAFGAAKSRLEGLLTRAGLVRRRALMAASVGDFVIFKHEGPGLFDCGIALVTGTHAHAPAHVGLMSIPRGQWVEAWGVA